MNAFIFHGTGGYPKENWFPWIKIELEKIGIETTVPHFPTPQGQSFETWLKVLEPSLAKINEETVLIGHSLGGLFLLKLLERLNHPIGMAVFVAAPVGVKPIKNFEQDEKFVGKFVFDWKKIKSRTKNFIVYHSDNDPYVELGNAELLKEKLRASLFVIHRAGHFNYPKYVKFERLFKLLKDRLALRGQAKGSGPTKDFIFTKNLNQRQMQIAKRAVVDADTYRKMELALVDSEESVKNFKNWAGMQVIRENAFRDYEIIDPEEQEFYDKIIFEVYNYVVGK